MEATQIRNEAILEENVWNDDYLKFFPTAYLHYKFGDNKVLSASYGRRINRPTYSMLNPFRLYLNPYAYIEGNPTLRPSFSENLEWSLVLHKNWVTTIYGSRTTSGFESVTRVDSNSNIQITAPSNFLTQYNSGAGVRKFPSYSVFL